MSTVSSTADLLIEINSVPSADNLIPSLAERFLPVMVPYARRRGLRDSLAASQAVHLAIWKAASKFDSSRFRVNADALVWNMFKNELRGLLRESTWRFGCEPMSVSTAMVPDGDDGFAELETVLSFSQTIDVLDDDSRTVAILATGLDRGEPRTQRELAEVLNVSIGTANTRLRSLRSSLAAAA